jgi:predicted metal-dependent peptidase
MTELLFILIHEIAHVALKHICRGENREPILWNIACDLYVNKIIIAKLTSFFRKKHIIYRLSNKNF